MESEGETGAKSIKIASVQICQICGDNVGTLVDSESFIACSVCAFPVYRPDCGYERKDGNQSCPQCKTDIRGRKLFLLILLLPWLCAVVVVATNTFGSPCCSLLHCHYCWGRCCRGWCAWLSRCCWCHYSCCNYCQTPSPATKPRKSLFSLPWTSVLGRLYLSLFFG